MNLSQILQNYPHTPAKWVLKAKVIRKPDRINPDRPFMIINMLDEQNQSIEGVFFGQNAVEHFARLAVGKDYLFNNGQVKTKKNSNDSF